MESSCEPRFRLIAGLGNPGREYAVTRHNVGFLLCDRLANRRGFQFRHEGKWNADIALFGGVLYCKPMTFMNRSGDALQALGHFFKIKPEQMLVVYDDAALPLGKLRIRASGSAGGHNGLQSIITRLGTDKVPRLRVGIGAAQDRVLTNHVLGRFAEEEKEPLAEALDRASAALELAQTGGLTAAMNKFNP